MAEFRRNRAAKPKLPTKKRERAAKALAKRVESTRGNVLKMLELFKGTPHLTGAVVEDVMIQMKMHTCEDAVVAQMALPQRHEILLVQNMMAQRSLASMDLPAVWKMARKIDDHMEPGDTRLLVEFLKGRGLLVPSTPLNDDEREAKMKKRADFEKMTLEALKNEVLEGRVA